MNEIGKTLKQLRSEKGMTQEDAAQAVGLTRQAISSYESGRTRPDIEMLSRLAELYGGDINELIYGRDESLRKARRLKLSVLISACIAVFGALAVSAGRFFENLLLPVSSGMDKKLLELRFALSEAIEVCESAVYLLFTLGCVLSIIFYARLNKAAAWKARLKFLGLFAIALAIASVPWALGDKIFGFWNYIYMPISAFVRACVFTALSFGIDFFRKSDERKKTFQK